MAPITRSTFVENTLCSFRGESKIVFGKIVGENGYSLRGIRKLHFSPPPPESHCRKIRFSNITRACEVAAGGSENVGRNVCGQGSVSSVAGAADDDDKRSPRSKDVRPERGRTSAKSRLRGNYSQRRIRRRRRRRTGSATRHQSRPEGISLRPSAVRAGPEFSILIFPTLYNFLPSAARPLVRAGRRGSCIFSIIRCTQTSVCHYGPKGFVCPEPSAARIARASYERRRGTEI